MIFHAFYNPEFVGDILLVRLGDGKTISYTKEKDLVILKNENDEIIGYNILNASKYFTNLTTGLIKITKEIVDTCNEILTMYQLPPITADLKDKFIVGKVVSLEEHPDSDHLHVCQIDLKDYTTQIVCGASNVAQNQLVVVATIGAVMPSGLIIKPSKLRKVDSNGMLCSARELHLNGDFNTSGIIVLDENKYQIGESFL
ncbi:MAG: YtpR family tRNA-binding protein [Coprobacillaceae bacterium]